MDLQFDEHIQPAALPSRKQDYANKPAVTSGWGLVKFDTTNPNTTEILQLTNVTIMSNEDCKEFFHKYIPRKIFTSSFVCIAPGNSTPCNGDSGGPLVLQDGKNTLIGLTSHGFGGCPLNAPVIFTRVSSYLDWIKENSHLKYFN
ncbi:chymotrypsinogen 2-like [Scaptodrosophila lebanonensis]|uniref:Chymotrypsinogen 2-like n=1 Tax=Drosophila lebanonensis TaxID=7225 RepID=A0A6J2UF91_DROLE|nr:chymotrypsinogen 2-like [Scaptodrosophila lebanonensis]